MSLREAALKALSALEYTAYGERPPAPEVRDALTALRTALAEEPDASGLYHRPVHKDSPNARPAFAVRAEAEEPVAWMKIEDPWGGNEAHFSRDEQVGWTALYTHPPRREPLTEEGVRRLYREAWTPESEANEVLAFARAIERAHGIGGES